MTRRAILAVFLLSACSVGPAPAPITDACTWERVYHVDEGRPLSALAPAIGVAATSGNLDQLRALIQRLDFSDRLTHDEKAQLVTHNRQVKALCPDPTPDAG